MDNAAARRSSPTIVGACSIEQIVETGTHRGASAEWLAQFHLPVYTVEIGNNFFEYSKLRLAKFPNIKLFHTNSLQFLPEISKEISRSTTLFYLDAHQKKHHPLGGGAANNIQDSERRRHRDR